ncbi:2-(hydroxymethyl)glutarate dehydrogenase [Roseovarius aestuarii]|uniref:2-(Hydroxymethyl)glutarate dehydrogenase n=2 Tax=Roseovarius aestuarii TaxID=475083 RepID=A0A1X7BTV4_9RHOB|nr:2-(hydroxymethyl)glutarate dehydrogenase [Roseovarius aestuarii]
MGLAMAKNLMKGGHSVIGFDLSGTAMNNHVLNGGQAADSPAEVAESAEIVITMLPNGKIVRHAIFDEGGIAETMQTRALLIDMSTIHPSETDGIRKDLAVKQIAMVDAPVGRTSVEAALGTSLFMVGATKDNLETVRPVLECMGDTIIDCGGPGTGSRMKIVNNLMTTSLNVLTAQILTFSDATGLDRDLAVSVMNGTAAGRGHMSTTYPAKVLKGDLTPAFMIDLAKKDLDIALALSNELGVSLSLPTQAEAIYAEAQEAGRGGQDWTAIFDMLHRNHFPAD